MYFGVPIRGIQHSSTQNRVEAHAQLALAADSRSQPSLPSCHLFFSSSFPLVKILYRLDAGRVENNRVWNYITRSIVIQFSYKVDIQALKIGTIVVVMAQPRDLGSGLGAITRLNLADENKEGNHVSGGNLTCNNNRQQSCWR